uniref:Uncharacterized protein n=1 Tax=Oryza glumipatula TaxID=40148 RepID=A0A0E0A633_9ORYZ
MGLTSPPVPLPLPPEGWDSGTEPWLPSPACTCASHLLIWSEMTLAAAISMHGVSDSFWSSSS